MNSFILTMRYQFLSLGPVTLGSFRLIIGVWFWRRMRKRTCWWSFIKKDSICQRSLLWQRRLINQRFLVERISPPENIDEVVGLVGSIKENFHRLISRYAPWIKRIPLEQGLRFEPTWKATHWRKGCGLREGNFLIVRFGTFALHSHRFLMSWALFNGCWSLGTHRVPNGHMAACGLPVFVTPLMWGIKPSHPRIWIGLSAGPFLPSCDGDPRNHRQTRLHVWGCWQASYIRNRKLCESEGNPSTIGLRRSSAASQWMIKQHLSFV